VLARLAQPCDLGACVETLDGYLSRGVLDHMTPLGVGLLTGLAEVLRTLLVFQ